MDKMNQAILKHLKINSRMSWQKIGKEVHLTGQAVAARVAQMEAQGIISAYTIRQDTLTRHFVTVFMNNADFSGFEQLLRKTPCVDSAYKVTGEACFQLICTPQNEAEFERFLNATLAYGQYKILHASRCVK